ncbi:hypothetical protein Vretimale_11220, partial [Volvox reticuliferus]
VNPNCAGCPVRGVCRAAADWEAYLAAGGAPDVEDAPRVTNYPGRKAVKEKREQAVAVTVLEVICTSQPLAASGTAPPNSAAKGKKTSTPGTMTDADATAVAAAGMQPPAKRQRTMQDFALAAAARRQQQQQQQQQQQACAATKDVVVAGENGARQEAASGRRGGSGGGLGAAGGADLEVLVTRGARHYLLTMRPQDGLLAGLWEFPGAIIQADARSGREIDEEEEEEEEADDDTTDVINAAPEPDKGNTGKNTWPTAVVAAGSTHTNSSTERQQASDALLRRLLGANVDLTGPGTAPAVAGSAPSDVGATQQPPHTHTHTHKHTLCVLARHDMGKYVHVFSHIRQTNYIQRVTAVFHGDIATLERLTVAVTSQGGAAAGVTSVAVCGDSEMPTRTENGSHNEGDDVLMVAEVTGTAKHGNEEPIPADAGGNGSSRGVKKGQGRGKKAVAAVTEKKQQQQQEQGATAAAVKPTDADPPAIMWASRQQLEGSHLGLSSGVRKIFQQAVGASDGGSGRGGRAASKGKGGASKAAGAKGR